DAKVIAISARCEHVAASIVIARSPRANAVSSLFSVNWPVGALSVKEPSTAEEVTSTARPSGATSDSTAPGSGVRCAETSPETAHGPAGGFCLESCAAAGCQNASAHQPPT